MADELYGLNDDVWEIRIFWENLDLLFLDLAFIIFNLNDLVDCLRCWFSVIEGILQGDNAVHFVIRHMCFRLGKELGPTGYIVIFRSA